MNDQDKKDPQFAYTLAKGFEILRAFGSGDARMSNREISAVTGISRPTVARLTRTLGMMGYLKYDAADTRYRLAVSLLQLVYPLLSQLTIRHLARPLMQELAEFAKGSVSLGMRDGTDIVLVETCVENIATSPKPEIGIARPIALTAFGRAYVSAADPAERVAILQAIKADSRFDFGAFEADLKIEQERLKSSGYCIAKGTHRVNFNAVAVPFRMSPTADLMVFNCAVASFRDQGNFIENEVAPRLVHLKQNVEMQLGVVTGASGDSNRRGKPSAA